MCKWSIVSVLVTPERTTSYTYTCGSTIDEIITGSELLNYDYDGELVTSITYSGELNQSISYGYNNDFMVDEMTYAGVATPVGYDNDGLLTGIHGYTIDRFETHGIPRRVFNSNLNRAYTYNGYGDVDSMTQTVGDTSITTSFTHNLAGQIKTRTDVVDTPSGTRTDSYEYFYDNRNRLERVELNNIVIEEYDYDSNGNRSVYSSTRAGLAGTSTYNDDDQLQANSNASYGYDANGRLATRTRNVVDGDPVITTYDYSSDGRLLSVTTPEHTITYRHNAFGNRVAKLVDGVVVEKYLWENKTRLLATYDGNNNIKQRYEYTVGNTPTAYTEGSSRYYILTDQLGSPRVITDDSGVVLREVEYDSFGNIVNDSNPSQELPFGFAGGLVDQHTGLIRFGFRDYDPETGRWTARDPIGFAGGDTNLYGYVLGDPVNGIDPDGLEVRVYSSDALGVDGINHSYVYSTETGSGRGANGSSGHELGDGVGGLDNPFAVVNLPRNMSESEFMSLIDSADNWNNGLYFPFVNDCHNDLERAFDHAGVEYPGAPNGRFDFDDNSRVDRSDY